MPILATENLTFLYNAGTPFEKAAVSDINFSAEKGEIIGVIGHTGSGKSTLIQHFNGLLEPSKGKMFVLDKDIWAKENRKKIRSVRFAVGLCFQYPEYQIFEDTIFNEIAYGPRQMGLDEAEIKERVFESMKFLGLKEDMASSSPFDHSGGQKRRIAIASIIAMQPEVLILDEPCAGLDPMGRDTILSLVKDYQREKGNTIIFVSHSMEDVAKIASRVMVLNKGRLAMLGTVNEVYSRGSELKEMGLSVPEITEVFIKLKEMGIDCRQDVFTVDGAVEELSRLNIAKEVL